MKPYQPASCTFYDKLALWAMRKTPVQFMPDIFDLGTKTYIKDIVTTPEKEEYVVLNTGFEIRLDVISQIDEGIVYLDLAVLEEE